MDFEEFGNEIEIDLTNIGEFPELPPWAENESKDFYTLFSEGSVEKASELIARERLEEYAPGKWQVKGSEIYSVEVIDNPYNGVPWSTCTCPNGQNRASRPTCYHSAAVLMKVLKLEEPTD